MNSPVEPIHALSFDIEDWFHIIDIDSLSDPSRWPEYPSIVEPRTRQILDILREYQTKATFFILGWVAERYPQLVRMIVDDGHEIGTHSYWHRKVYEMAPWSFREDLKWSVEVIERCAGVGVSGFRASSFSITPGCSWAFVVLSEAGLRYDASLFPAARAHGGCPCAPQPHWLDLKRGNRLAELPMSMMNLAGARFCFSGGGYLRLLPSWLIDVGMRQAEREGRPAVVYLHPRDFATDCPVVPMPASRRFKCYVGLGRTEAKLRRLLQTYRFTTCSAVLDHYLGSEFSDATSRVPHTLQAHKAA